MLLRRTAARGPARTRAVIALPAMLAAGLTLTACTADGGAADEGTGQEQEAAAATEPVRVLASFYPLVHAVEQVGGDLVEVASLTPAGAEPHDLEVSPAQLREMAQVDAVVYLSGFQPAVDDAIAARQPENVLDVFDVADLQPAPEEHDHEGGAEPHDEAEEESHTADDGHDDHGSLDPHFWLDPTRLAAVGEEIAAVLSEAAPEHADAFAANAEAFTADLTALDEQLAAGLAQCERDVVITGHTAFGYLAERYGFTEIGVAGIDPEAEPSPARLREIAEEVREHGVTAVYTESAASPAVADTLAADLGLEVLVLDPVETLADPSTDYRGVMESNLEALRTGLGCE
ncbi:metal ABC transporter solute-binding protein, Zn/Mn family [Actinotalea sp. Marseille-Q4924]|uniref:metal ABC transporter substrate-binding protein n=1 Tax=Actinotalea sp. Marseille-Q4924 TaxID=2866571 RepID=UPI001CE47453|nr:zinc ABC transporter substrate-binding protein [Actinotalea sp. Marseille-Q4924]